MLGNNTCNLYQPRYTLNPKPLEFLALLGAVLAVGLQGVGVC